MRETVKRFEEMNRQDREAWQNGVRVSLEGVATQAELEQQRRETVERFRKALQSIQTGNQQRNATCSQAEAHRAALAALNAEHHQLAAEAPRRKHPSCFTR